MNLPLTLEEVSQVLWSAQGIVDSDGHRTVPSAGALYPLEVYLLAGNVRDLPTGIYQYRPRGHELAALAEGDKRSDLCSASLGQDFILRAPASIIISAIYQRTTWKYGQRGRRYVHMEVGHVAQNISLQAEALNLGTVVVGAFRDSSVKKIFGMLGEEQPLCIMPIGRFESVGEN